MLYGFIKLIRPSVTLIIFSPKIPDLKLFSKKVVYRLCYSKNS